MSTATANCSAGCSSDSLTCSKATDGDRKSLSACLTSSAQNRIWIQVDLKRELFIYKMSLFYLRYSNRRIRSVTVAFSDGSEQAVSGFQLLNCEILDSRKMIDNCYNYPNTVFDLIVFRSELWWRPRRWRHPENDSNLYQIHLNNCNGTMCSRCFMEWLNRDWGFWHWCYTRVLDQMIFTVLWYGFRTCHVTQTERYDILFYLDWDQLSYLISVVKSRSKVKVMISRRMIIIIVNRLIKWKNLLACISYQSKYNFRSRRLFALSVCRF
jgi:hypothetical protein